MIIAELCNYAAGYGGNFMASLKSMERAAKADDPNNEVIYIFPQSAKGKEWTSVLQEQHKVFFLSGGRIQDNIDLVKWCKHECVDVLHVHFYGITTFFIVGWLSKTIIVHHYHNTIVNPNSFKQSLLKLLSCRVDQFVGCSKTVSDSLVEAGYNKVKCSFITNRIDFSRFDAVHNPHPFNENQRNLLILGTDFYRKGVDIAIKAIEPIAAKYNICLHIITHSPDDTKDHVLDVMGSFPEWVHLLSPTEFIGDYYRASDIFLSPSREEGFCYAIHEALYCGCMAFKSDLPAMNYGLDGEDFITLKDDLCQRIEMVLSMDKEELERRINDLRTQVIARFGIDEWGEEVFSLYKNVLYSK